MATRHSIFTLFIFCIFTSCKHETKVIVSPIFADSILTNNFSPAAIKFNEEEILFWKNRIRPDGIDIVNGSKYAAALAARFNLTGNIGDLKKSDSILLQLSGAFNNKEAGPFLALTSHAILQHKFREADSILNIAKAIGLKKYESGAAAFDVDFELGRISMAENDLAGIHFDNDYGYRFRQSKLAHYYGSLDSSIAYMEKAYELAGSNPGLKQTALSNAADLYIHAGNLEKAYEYYVKCVRMNPADLHSLMGIGWISLVHDGNDSLAEKIFLFVRSKTQSAEPVFKLVMMAQHKKDTLLEKKYALQFEEMVTLPAFGNMYNKYLIQLYTGILKDATKANAVALKELSNRATPQTYAWYAWALLNDNKKEEAYQVYEKYVSGKPLEGLELYYMGKLMKSLNKGYNAQQYFKEASRNEYDLSPDIVNDLRSLSEK